jgi:hypothetical protein
VPLCELNDATPGEQRAYATLVERVAIATSDPLAATLALAENLDTHDILVAFLLLTRSLFRLSETAPASAIEKKRQDHANALRTVRATCVQRSNSLATPLAFIDAAIAHPDQAVGLAELFATSSAIWPKEISQTNDLGRLPLPVYATAFGQYVAPRCEYLADRLPWQGLTLSQVALATALSQEWTGTLSELVETTKNLHP